MAGDQNKIPAGRYNVSGTMKVYTHVEVDEDGTARVIKDVMSVESHQIDRPADVWDSDDHEVDQLVADALVERLDGDPSAWDSSDGMRY
jgi:hypothetical protein